MNERKSRQTKRVKTGSTNIVDLVEIMKRSFIQGLEEPTIVISHCTQRKYHSNVGNSSFMATLGVGDPRTRSRSGTRMHSQKARQAVKIFLPSVFLLFLSFLASLLFFVFTTFLKSSLSTYSIQSAVVFISAEYKLCVST